MVTSRKDAADRSSSGGGRVCWRTVVPGLPQWRSGQRERGAVLLGSYLSAMAAGAFGWGSGVGAALLIFAFLAHSASAADAIRRSAFPGFGRWAPWFSAMVGLGAAGYVPALAVALNLAYPARTAEGGFLINRVAYAQEAPEPGQRVWLDGAEPGSPRGLARVVAVGGQVISWSGAGVVVDGRPPISDALTIPAASRSRGAFEVPDRALLIVCSDPLCPEHPGFGGGPGLTHLAIVPADRVIGRAWARSYPIWDRQPLG